MRRSLTVVGILSVAPLCKQTRQLTGALLVGTLASYHLSASDSASGSAGLRSLLRRGLLPLLGLCVATSDGAAALGAAAWDACATIFAARRQVHARPLHPRACKLLTLIPPVALSPCANAPRVRVLRARVLQIAAHTTAKDAAPAAGATPVAGASASGGAEGGSGDGGGGTKDGGARDEDTDTLEILVHNISHSDAVLSFAALVAALGTAPGAAGGGDAPWPDPDGADGTAAEVLLARPKFFSFGPIMRALLAHSGGALPKGGGGGGGAADPGAGARGGCRLSPALFPVLSRDDQNPAHPLIRTNSAPSTPSSSASSPARAPVMMRAARSDGSVPSSTTTTTTTTTSSSSSSSSSFSSAAATASPTGSLLPPLPAAAPGGALSGAAAAVAAAAEEPLRLPVGLRLTPPCELGGEDLQQAGGTAAMGLEDLTKLVRFRGSDFQTLQARCAGAGAGAAGGAATGAGAVSGDAPAPRAAVDGVYFPLLAIAVPQWLENLATTYGRRGGGRGGGRGQAAWPEDADSAGVARDATPSVRKLVYLVSGAGWPRDESAKELNSTEALAALLELWLNVHYPFVQVPRMLRCLPAWTLASHLRKHS